MSRVRVSLRADSPLDSFVDGQTHLVVTREPVEVDEAQVGLATRARLDVEIVPVRAPQAAPVSKSPTPPAEAPEREEK